MIRTKRIYKQQLIFFMTMLCLLSCSKTTAVDDAINGQRLVSATTLRAHPGYYRMGLSFVADKADVSRCEVAWGNPKQRINIDIQQSSNDTIYTVIEDLMEGKYTFDVITYDANGVISDLTLRVHTTVYGDNYAASLTNRSVRDIYFIGNTIPYIEWLPTVGQDLGIAIRYQRENNSPRMKFSERAASVVELPEYKAGGMITYRTAYLPELHAIDTLYAAEVQLAAPPYYSSITNKHVAEKSGLVSQIVSQSTISLHEGVDYSTLQFQKADRNPVSLFILEADLNNGNLGLSTLMPNNDTQFSLQTVLGMSQHRENAGSQVVAAVNADFFDWSGLPWGPVIIDGSIVKDYVRDGAGSTYIGTRKDGSLSIGYASPLTALDYQRFQNLVGGGAHMLYNNGVRQVFNDTDRHPRTMVGFTADKKVYFVVVDGRQPSYSVGMTIDELASIIGSLGVTYALNLDGGGSSTMVVKQDGSLKVVNRYSDASLRAVANALAIVHK
ncbi:phosphodiester glycosidase family protein [Sphingobacterium pedocola]|uniref:Phosphodiester glycosidase domain-containing protein n=1 Tax=Sphingobacterium pedocola TaxID=2082722 RepID=A0ABR9T9G6_9SPHI|nr:phosphodiester glycosidase family protein [Sphingobacterium pedocola]MBE8721995.1 hypothetical protein [Sphingobacterium pedocola]